MSGLWFEGAGRGFTPFHWIAARTPVNPYGSIMEARLRIAALLCMGLAFASPALAQSEGLSLTVDRVWEENPSYASHRLGHVLVSVTNNARRSYEWVMVDCTFTLDGRPVDSTRVSIMNLQRGQTGTDSSTVGPIALFDGATCRIGPVSQR